MVIKINTRRLAGVIVGVVVDVVVGVMIGVLVMNRHCSNEIKTGARDRAACLATASTWMARRCCEQATYRGP